MGKLCCTRCMGVLTVMEVKCYRAWSPLTAGILLGVPELNSNGAPERGCSPVSWGWRDDNPLSWAGEDVLLTCRRCALGKGCAVK